MSLKRHGHWFMCKICKPSKTFQWNHSTNAFWPLIIHQVQICLLWIKGALQSIHWYLEGEKNNQRFPSVSNQTYNITFFWSHLSWVQIFLLLLASYLISIKFLNFSVPHFPHQKIKQAIYMIAITSIIIKHKMKIIMPLPHRGVVRLKLK